jgi:glycosyltransferase involved in cell wall biosynthesis
VTTPAFTVFTSTYNRAHTLDVPYESLRRQTFRDFEWVMVDDGSTDGTREKVAGWPLRYEWRRNQGRNAAINRGVELARGELFVILDSDDELVPEALATWKRAWDGLGDRDAYFGVMCHCRTPERILGTPPAAPLVTNGLEYMLTRDIDYDMTSAVRTDVMRQHPFPAIADAPFVPEGLVWSRIMRRYRALVIPEVLEIKHYASDGFTANLASSYIRHAAGRYWYFVTNLNENGDAMWRWSKKRWLKDTVQLGRMMFHARRGIADTRRALREGLAKLAFLAALPAAWVLSVRDAHVASRRPRSGPP